MFWLILFGFALAGGWLVWHSLRKLKALRRAEEERFVSFMAETSGRTKLVNPSAEPAPAPSPAMSPTPGDGLVPQKLLFEAARKAGEAGEPSLAIQLYARLLARYPSTGFAVQVRAGVEAQKKKLAKS